MEGRPILAIQFSSDGTPGDRLIRYYTWSDISHCDLVLPDGTLLGARPPALEFPDIVPGVQIRPPDYIPFWLKQVYTFNPTIPPGSVWETRIIELCRSVIGAGYNLAADLGIRVHRDLSPPDGPEWMCSQLLGWAFATAGYPLLNQPLYNRITPEQLRQSPLLRMQP